MNTSYFTNITRLVNRDKIPRIVSIARYAPIWLRGQIREMKELAPTGAILHDYKNGIIGEEEYERLYTEQVLDNLDPSAIIEKLADDDILCCYECNEPDFFCHRTIVSKWIEANTGVIISEMESNYG